MEAVQRPVRSRHHRHTENPEGLQGEANDRVLLPPEPGDFDSELGLVWQKSKKRHFKRVGETDLGVRNGEDNAAGGAVDTNDIPRGAGVAVAPSAPPVEEIDTIIADYKTQKNKVMEQHSVIESKKDLMRQRKENERTKIISVFSNILDILADKEASLLCKLDERYRHQEDKLEELLTSTEDAIDSINTETIIAENVKTGDSHFQDVSVADIIPLLNDIKAGVEERAETLQNDEREMAEIELNDEAYGIIDSLVYVTIPGIENADENETNEDEDEVDDQETIENTDIDSEQNQEGESTENVTLTDTENVNEISDNNAVGNEESENTEREVASEMSNLQVELDHPSPTAPPQPDAEEDPPPYWQAIGLSGPTETDNLPTPHSPAVVSSDRVPHYSGASQYVDSASGGQQSNELLFFHNILLKRPYDSRAPKPVALSWKMEKILVADRANSKIKVYSGIGGVIPSFKFITEMYLGGCEIYDMAFVEARGEELRHVITIPRAKTLMFVSIGSDKVFKMMYKLKLSRGYTGVAKGPTGNTLVCADALPHNGEARIDIVNIQGHVLRTFKCTCSLLYFSYPRCVEVFNQAIIVADWKLNLVVVLHEDGGAIAQYAGTRSYPLKEPCSLTIDQFGNIMVVDGKTGNIHVIDLYCQPLEVIKCPRGETAKLISFDKSSHRLAVYRKTGDIGIYDFKGGYHTVSRNVETPVHAVRYINQPEHHINQPEYQGALPLVEGMLPTTVANAGGGRQRQAMDPCMNQLEYIYGNQQDHQLPLVEGMLPSTIASIGTGRQRQANSRGNYNMFHL